MTDAVGTIEVLTYAENLGVKNLLSRINQTDQKGFVRDYDENNNLIRSIDSEGKVTEYSYNATNQRISKVEAPETQAVRLTEYQYLSDQLDLLTETRSPSVKTGQYKTVQVEYNPDNTVQSITQKGFRTDGSAITRTTAFQYNNLGQIKEIDGPLDALDDIITTLTYYECAAGEKCGQLASVSNALNQTTTYDSYDANGRITQTTSPLGLVTVYSYDLRGRLTDIAQTPA